MRKRLYICDRDGKRMTCSGKLLVGRSGRFLKKPFCVDGKDPKKRWAVARWLDCNWLLCRLCAKEHFKKEYRRG